VGKGKKLLLKKELEAKRPERNKLLSKVVLREGLKKLLLKKLLPKKM
jgi:hypothetical protein